MKDPQAVLNILNYSIGAKRKTFGHSFEAAYHTVKLGDEIFKGQRDIPTRLAHINFDFKDKVVMDLGCNAGGMLHELSSSIKMGIGVDYSAKVINGANAIKAYNGLNNLSFYTFNLDKEPLKLLTNFAYGEKIDVCFVLAIALWIKKWKEIVQYCHTVSDTLIYESNGNEDYQQEQEAFLKTLFTNVKMLADRSDDDNRGNAGRLLRKLFICNK